MAGFPGIKDEIQDEIVDVNIVGGSSAGTQYTEGDTDASITGVALMWEDTGDTLRAVSAAKPLPVSASIDTTGLATSAKQDTIIGHVDGIETLLTAIDGHIDGLETSNSAIQTSVELIDDAIKADDAAFTPATTKVMMAGFEYDDSSPDSVDEGDAGAARMSARREIYTQLRDAAGNERGANVNASNELLVALSSVPSHAVTNAGTFVVQENGAALTSLQLIDDVVYTDDTSTHSTGNSKGALIMAAATPTDGSVNANDIGAVAMTTDRKLHVSVQDALPTGTNAIGKLSANSGVDIGDVDITSVVPGTGATNLGKAEDGGHTTGDTGVFALAVRNDTPNAALTNADADYTQISANKLGSIRTAALEDDLATAATKHVKKYYTNAGAVTDGIVWSPAAGARWFITHLSFNVSAACTVTFEDDLSGGDSAVYKGEFAANSGAVLTFPEVPMFSGEDAADLLVTTSAGNIYVTVVGYEI